MKKRANHLFAMGVKQMRQFISQNEMVGKNCMRQFRAYLEIMKTEL